MRHVKGAETFLTAWRRLAGYPPGTRVGDATYVKSAIVGWIDARPS